ncbi:MAG: hypothetical protein NTV60_00985 [Candidatus Kaiserbacteria bacterium]|nr:hypothetical protein [Candidatus Kaiserbacteria bacterium]
MIYLVLVVGTLLLLVGFIVLTEYERAHTVRFFAHEREQLDAFVKRIEFIIENVDLAAFMRDEVHHATNSIGHFFAHLSLQAVRAIERLLTRLVRYLRIQNEESTSPRENAREFVKTLSDFKDNLHATHPDIDVLEVK